jgi:hypothetical protein
VLQRGLGARQAAPASLACLDAVTCRRRDGQCPLQQAGSERWQGRLKRR